MTSRQRILIVDDEPEIRAELAEYLVEKGYEVSQASNGVEAFETFQREGADAVITDMRMPRGTGEQLTRWLREITPCLPIIVITGHYSQDDLALARQAGANAAIKKPVGLRELSETLKSLLRPGDKPPRGADTP